MYKKNKIKFIKTKERVILGDVLPYEIPLFFTNDYFYNYLRKRDSNQEPNILKEKIFKAPKKLDYKIPFNYLIYNKNNSFRTLSIIHPYNQMKVIDFYDKNKNLMLYYCNNSKYSLRKPVKVSSLEFFNDSIHKELLKDNHKVEQNIHEYKSYSTFFSYSPYNTLYKFFDDKKFYRAEKKFEKMISLDISKCFNSIYTHSIVWTILGKENVKNNKLFNGNFGAEFDTLMQKMNYNETNGIIIGPEFSRVFAEIILQKIDKNIFELLNKNKLFNGKNYQIYRYVDDYYIFFNNDNDFKIIEDILKIELEKYNLFLNDKKKKIYKRPILTENSIAKIKISKLFNGLYNFITLDNGERKLSLNIKSKIIIDDLKVILNDSNIDYEEISGYTLGIIKKNLKKFLNAFSKLEENFKEKNINKLKIFIDSILDIIFSIHGEGRKISYIINISYIVNLILELFRNKNRKRTKGIFINFSIGDINLIKKRIFDELFFLLKNNKSIENNSIVNIYILNLLQTLGKNYKLEEENLIKFIFENNKNNYFTLIGLLNYIENDNDNSYKEIKKNILEEINKKFIDSIKKFGEDNAFIDTETTLLFLDIINCPFVNNEYKKKIIGYIGVNDNKIELINFIQENKITFIKWGKNFNFSSSINKKQKIEVY